MYPIDLKIIFGISLLQPGPPKYVFLATPLKEGKAEQKQNLKKDQNGTKTAKLKFRTGQNDIRRLDGRVTSFNETAKFWIEQLQKLFVVLKA